MDVHQVYRPSVTGVLRAYRWRQGHDAAWQVLADHTLSQLRWPAAAQPGRWRVVTGHPDKWGSVRHDLTTDHIEVPTDLGAAAERADTLRHAAKVLIMLRVWLRASRGGVDAAATDEDQEWAFALAGGHAGDVVVDAHGWRERVLASFTKAARRLVDDVGIQRHREPPVGLPGWPPGRQLDPVLAERIAATYMRRILTPDQTGELGNTGSQATSSCIIAEDNEPTPGVVLQDHQRQHWTPATPQRDRPARFA